MKRSTTALALTASLVAASCANDANGTPSRSGDTADTTEVSTSGSAQTDETANNNGNSDAESPPPTGGSNTQPVSAADDTKPDVGLLRFENCDDLLGYLKAEATERVTAYGLGDGGLVRVDELTSASLAPSSGAESLEDGSDSGATGAPSDLGAASPSDTGTNVQEAGIDEPDIIKTDGKHLVTVADTTLSVFDITERAPRRQLTVELGAYPESLMLAGGRAFVFANGSTATGGADGDPQSPSVGPDSDDWFAATTVLEVSLDNDPKVVNTMTIQGSFQGARLIGETLRVVVASPTDSFPWVYPQNTAGEEKALKANQEVISASTIEDWIPDARVNEGGPAPLLDCTDVHRPAEFSGFEMVSLLEFDATEGINSENSPQSSIAVLASGGTVYSSTDRFYVAAPNYSRFVVRPFDAEEDFIEPERPKATTNIHSFSIAPDAPAEYVASGSVDGWLLNQFSLDEHEGNLRVITTQGTEVFDPNGNPGSESFLRVMSEEDGVLTQIGVVGGLGKGEQLHSARLFDDVGFAVTFRQIDPFYVIDLSDPTKPEITGELKIPGVSTYLHPVGNGMILGLGAAATDNGGRTGLKVSLFDVNDPENPTEVSTWIAPEAYSIAEGDHRGFHFSDGVAVIPVSSLDNDTGEQSSYAIVLEIGEKIVERGRIEVGNVDQANSSDCTPLALDPTDPVQRDVAWIRENGGQVQVCGKDAVGGWGTLSCWSVESRDNLIQNLGPELAAKVDVGAGEYVEFCEPPYLGKEIRRVIAVDNTYYMLSTIAVQANDRNTLDLIGAVPVPTAGDAVAFEDGTSGTVAE